MVALKLAKHLRSMTPLMAAASGVNTSLRLSSGWAAAKPKSIMARGVKVSLVMSKRLVQQARGVSGVLHRIDGGGQRDANHIGSHRHSPKDGYGGHTLPRAQGMDHIPRPWVSAWAA